ncbi:DUF1801 domain-containing protein [Streptomyces luteolus]|uniref:DUF1801 domain-containing protein n=1 Tax=Streptomyces luteolus TaxID=3043615 RepID=A0ABT6SU91_9ACTN|nr:DUF1801 domain-containing protein [Streptomyces sp. B-S-A12]MDI3419182.1 DUF1801 domain-containing protein [Streptomyces sp. B-S-A12]
MTNEVPKAWQSCLEAANAEVAAIARRAREVVREAVPDAAEEVDVPARLLAFTFAPGTYKGIAVGLVLHSRHVNLQFGEGVELAAHDPDGLLTGTGKKARHVKLHAPEDPEDPRVVELVRAAAARRRAQLADG